MVNVFLTWCRRGVDGFRCDAGYMIPVPVWKYIVTFGSQRISEHDFPVELGGKISINRDILNQGNFNWAYSELFQNYDRSQIEAYLPEAIVISQAVGLTLHFAETHDNLRLPRASHDLCQNAHCPVCAFARCRAPLDLPTVSNGLRPKDQRA